jgi:hypothetical protein
MGVTRNRLYCRILQRDEPHEQKSCCTVGMLISMLGAGSQPFCRLCPHDGCVQAANGCAGRLNITGTVRLIRRAARTVFE